MKSMDYKFKKKGYKYKNIYTLFNVYGMYLCIVHAKRTHLLVAIMADISK